VTKPDEPAIKKSYSSAEKTSPQESTNISFCSLQSRCGTIVEFVTSNAIWHKFSVIQAHLLQSFACRMGFCMQILAKKYKVKRWTLEKKGGFIVCSLLTTVYRQ
jgi:hypothetical protein